MGSQDLPHVARIEQRTDKTVRLHVEIVDYTPGQEIEVSGYLTQGINTYHAFRDKKHVPLAKPSDSSQSGVLVPVELPALDLSQDDPQHERFIDALMGVSMAADALRALARHDLAGAEEATRSMAYYANRAMGTD